MNDVVGNVFNIQHFSIDDGPGIRTVVFLKGCPLRCKWCGNPESQKCAMQVAWTKGECIGCGACEKELSQIDCRLGESGVAWNDSITVDGELAHAVRRVCPSQALHVIGGPKTVADVIIEVKKDVPFYETSGGGLTLSGGEPLMQAAFSKALLKRAKSEGIATCMETTGYGRWEEVRPVIALLDVLYMDVKSLSTEQHKAYTGVSNEGILDNLHRIREEFSSLPITIRTPVVPEFNDTKEEIAAIAELAKKLGCAYEPLKYHRLGEPKYTSLQREYPMGDVELSDEKFEEIQRVVQEVLGR